MNPSLVQKICMGARFGPDAFRRFGKELLKEADTCFFRYPKLHDEYFNNYTIMWQPLLKNRQYEMAENIWYFALDLVHEWERSNTPSRVHKGTPYYFLGVTQILAEKIDEGFLAMHQALEEDRKAQKREDPEAPAYWFVTLDAERKDQFFGDHVKIYSRNVQEKIEYYNQTREGNLTIDKVKKEFLQNPDLQEEAFRFVYFIAKTKQLLETPEYLRDSQFSSLQLAKTYFDICLITEKTVTNKHPSINETKLEFETIMQHCEAEFLPDKSIRSTIYHDYNCHFEDTLKAILEGSYTKVEAQDISHDFYIAH